MIFKFLSIVSVLTYKGEPTCRQTVTTASGTHAPRRICGGDLIFEDNFNSFDQGKWGHEVNDNGGGNGEFQVYVNDRQNSFTKNGNLHVRATLTQPAEEDTAGGPWNETIQDFADIPSPVRSARMVSRNAFSFKYGRVEVNAKMPAGDWLWPAIWFMPKNSEYGIWPASGEIDLTETRGNRDLSINGGQIGTQQTGATLHFGPTGHDAWGAAHKTRNNPQGYDRAFHKYQMEWSPHGFKFAIDNQHLLTIPVGSGFWERGRFQQLHVPNPWQRGTAMAPFDKEFFFIINLAVGGMNFFPDQARNPDGKPWRNNSPHPKQDFWSGRNKWLKTWRMNTDDSHLVVDYVRVWAL